MFGFLKRRRRRTAAARPFPAEWRALLEAGAPYARKLPPELHAKLHAHMQVFLDEKHFEGCGGFQLDDAARLVIAAYACLLLLERPGDYYPGLYSILVYPGAFIAPIDEPDESGIVWEPEEEREGEAWESGVIILSWEDVQRDLRAFNGRNVILHEFAHHLHLVDGVLEGAHFLQSREEQAEWASVLRQHYQRHVAAVTGRRRTFLDEYGAEDPAEYLAVLTEAFFEQPRRLHQRFPSLYEQLQRYYRQDPRRYFDV